MELSQRDGKDVLLTLNLIFVKHVAERLRIINYPTNNDCINYMMYHYNVFITLQRVYNVATYS